MKTLTVADVKARFAERFAAFTDDERRGFRQRFIVHDYEIFPDDVLLTTLDLGSCDFRAVWGVDAIRDHIRRVFLRDDSTVFVGFNNKNFDNRITDAILAGVGNAGLKQLSDELIEGAPSMLDLPWRSGREGRYRPN